ncbi:hypothetical protein NBRC116589_13530 [Ruegeria sp. HU-ET01832]|uniref:hypothetical protein n=1 Tax=Ruegeria sp. HU-ET01832 TaxID=3135906 RepID=UPI00310475FA
MQKEVLRFSSGNMVGQEWSWSFIVEQHANGAYSLSAKQEMIDPVDKVDEIHLETVDGLRRGADLYHELCQMLEGIGEQLSEFDIDKIAETLLPFDTELSDQFRRGEVLLLRREQRRRRKESQGRALIVEPFQRKIEEYCAKLDGHLTRGVAGIHRPSERTRIRAFLEEYVQSNQRLPSGFHKWNLGNGFLSGEHDFGDLGDT